jgi:uncharacterized protein (TIGR03435 family)
MNPWLHRVSILCLLCASIISGASAAESRGLPGNAALQFDVASVRENKSDGAAYSNVPLDRSDTFFPVGCTFRAMNEPFVAYLIFAYKLKISEFRGGLMRSLPAWAIKDRFDIVAKCELPSITKDDMRRMLQTLLAERFGL